jgi:hypothetical protein
MRSIRFPSRALKAPLPTHVRLQIVGSAAEPPAGDGWLHEIKHDGHRLVAIVDGKAFSGFSAATAMTGANCFALRSTASPPLAASWC